MFAKQVYGEMSVEKLCLQCHSSVTPLTGTAVLLPHPKPDVHLPLPQYPLVLALAHT